MNVVLTVGGVLGIILAIALFVVLPQIAALGIFAGAGLIEVKRGPGGIDITRPLEDITFLDIYKAVECIEDEKLFHFHENPNPECPVGKNIHNILDDKLQSVQEAMEKKLASITLADVKNDLIPLL